MNAKIFRKLILFVIMVLPIIFPKCECDDKIPNEPDEPDQKSNYYFEQAFPGVKGEPQTFIVNGDTIIVQKIDDKYVFQGDIILTEDQLKPGSTKGIGLRTFIYRWTNNTVYYSINEDIPNQVRITDAIAHWQEKTPLKFVKRTDQANYVEFIGDPYGCYSQMGMVGGRQIIGLADWGTKGSVIHEIGHTVGLHHEHSRIDRDQYIIVHYEAIEPGYESVYDKFVTQFKTPQFDFKSIMLYSCYAFSKVENVPVMTTLDGASTFYAQRVGLSDDDINIINSMYSNWSPSIPEIKTSIPTDITKQSATIGYEVKSDGGVKVTEVGLYWGTSSNPEVNGTKVVGIINNTNFGTSISDLKPDTKYYVKAYAINGVGTGYGTTESFTTLIAKPVAEFTADQTSINVGGSVQFTDKSTNNPTSWSWDFGDGTTSTTQNPFHTYLTGGTYTVSLTAKNTSGFDDEVKTNFIKVDANVPVYLSSVIENSTPSVIEISFSLPLADIHQSQSAFSLMVNGIERSYDGWSILETKILLCIPIPVVKGETVTVTYSKPSSYPIQTPSGSQVGSFIANVTNNVDKEIIGIIFNPNLTYETVTDIDGNTYKTIKIGTQTWMAENLKTTKYNDNTPIPNIMGGQQWMDLTSGAYCFYDNFISNRETYGALYNWYAVNTGKLCPNGWHVPISNEFYPLTGNFGGDDYKIKETTYIHWKFLYGHEGTNESGFTALPGGYLLLNDFLGIGGYGNWWTASEYDTNKEILALMFEVRNFTSKTSIYQTSKTVGCSVRCLKN
jgi:uncharacterized protein (TIGR02145 family)